MKILSTCAVALLFVAGAPALAAAPQISAGRYHNLAVTDNGAVYWWGKEYGLSYYLKKPAHAQPPTLVAGLPKVSAVAAGTWHSVALAEDGAVFEWGFSPYQIHETMTKPRTPGACEAARATWTGHGKDPCADEEKAMYAQMYVEKPMPIPGIPSARAIAATDSVTVALGRDGNVYCWAPNADPQRVPGLEKITSIRLGGFHGVALREDGAVLTWGSNVNGELGRSLQSSSGGESICGNPKPQVVFDGAVGIGASVKNSYAWRADGSVWGWGDNSGKLDAGKGPSADKIDLPRKIATIPKVTQIGGGLLHVIARSSDGKVYAWGSNYNNSIWSGDTMRSSTTPVALTAFNEIGAISAYDHDIALTRDGYVCAWGDNSYGAARPDSAQRTVPAPVPVMLDDGKTPLKLLGNRNADGKEKSLICGVVQ